MLTSTDTPVACAAASSASRKTLREVNALGREDFVILFGSLFERSPWIAAAAWPSRPWRTRGALHQAFCDVLRRSTGAEQLALIRAHPDLVGRAALAGTLSKESTAEQRAAGLDPDALTSNEIEQFTAANAAYAARFEFPFVICARDNRKASILAGLRDRLRNDREAEIATALQEIERIAWHRLNDVVDDNNGDRP